MSFFTSQAQTWDYKDSGTSFLLLDLSIPPEQSDVAYAAGSLYTVDSEGIIIKTIDGGETWETIYPVSGTVPSLTKIEFITPLKGFAVGWGNTFLMTEDGGETWQDVNISSNIWVHRSLTFYDQNLGYVYAINNDYELETYITHDGGATWTFGSNTEGMATFDLAFANETTLFSVGSDQMISKSIDGGESWNIISTGTPTFYNFAVFFKDVDNGIVSSEDGTLLTTHDSGATWDAFSTGYHNFYGLNYKGNDVFATGTDLDVYYSPDNGSTCSSIHDGPPVGTFYDIEFFADNSALICGSGGTILKAIDILGESTGPENDLCEDAIAIGCGDTIVGETLTATDSGENSAPDVWYSFTGTGEAETVTLSLCDGGTDYDSNLRVFDACGGNVVAVNDDYCGTQSELSFISDGTSTYYVMVEGFDSNSGNFSLVVSCDLILDNHDNSIEGFSYYPNPTANLINLNAQENIESKTIYNILGQKLVDQNSNTLSTQIDVDHLTPGTYFMNVLVNGETGTYKVVKE